MPLAVNTQPVVEYQYAYPKDLMNEVADLFLAGINESNFSIVSPEKLEQLDQNSIIKLLNESWNLFWNNPDAFRKWEEDCIKKLKSII